MRGIRGLAVVAGVGIALVAIAWSSGSRPEVDELAHARRLTGAELESRRIEVGDVALHVVLAGPEGGEPVLLLHGFPEFWFSWHRQLAALAEAGFRVAAPDLRGYNRSDKPADPDRYGSHHHVRDVLGLLEALGWSTVNVAGHDVGGGVTWRLVFEHPERLRRAVVFNAAHPMGWDAARPQDDPDSISWFRSFFQLPFLPELVARSGDWWLLGRNLRQTSRAGTFADGTLDLYKASWARDNAISTMIHGYRAEFREIRGVPEDGRPAVPVRLVWGEQDAFIPLEGGRLSAERLDPGATLFVPEASHWILHEEPELTSRVLIEFFGGGRG